MTEDCSMMLEEMQAEVGRCEAEIRKILRGLV